MTNLHLFFSLFSATLGAYYVFSRLSVFRLSCLLYNFLQVIQGGGGELASHLFSQSCMKVKTCV